MIYLRGLNVAAGPETEIWVERAMPYFQRTDLQFCSHYQTPPQAEPDRYAAVIAGSRFVYFSDFIFREYRRSGNTAVQDGWKAAMQRLLGAAPFGDGLPGTVLGIPRRRANDLLLTLLHYIPTRKSLEIDTIEEPGSFAGEVLCLQRTASQVIDFETGLPLQREGSAFLLPVKKGRLLLEIPGYFH